MFVKVWSKLASAVGFAEAKESAGTANRCIETGGYFPTPLCLKRKKGKTTRRTQHQLLARNFHGAFNFHANANSLFRHANHILPGQEVPLSNFISQDVRSKHNRMVRLKSSI